MQRPTAQGCAFFSDSLSRQHLKQALRPTRGGSVVRLVAIPAAALPTAHASWCALARHVQSSSSHVCLAGVRCLRWLRASVASYSEPALMRRATTLQTTHNLDEKRRPLAQFSTFWSAARAPRQRMLYQRLCFGAESPVSLAKHLAPQRWPLAARSQCRIEGNTGHSLHPRTQSRSLCLRVRAVRLSDRQSTSGTVLPDTVVQLLVATSPDCSSLRMHILTCCSTCVTPGARIYSFRHLIRWSL